MLEPYVGEIQYVAFTFAPRGWALCNGQLLPIAQNQALFSLLGTTYGGDGVTTFALPNLQGRVMVGQDGGEYPLGATGGQADVTLDTTHLPPHLHTYDVADRRAGSPSPAGATFAEGPLAYAGGADTALAPEAVSTAGNGQPHSNLQPSLALTALIALQGIYPTRN